MGQKCSLADCADYGLSYSIRPMQKEDLDILACAERLCHAHPWSAELFLQELDNPLSTIDLLYMDGQLAGYLCSWLVCGELHIHNVATLPHFRRRGVAGRLMRHVMGRCTGLEPEKVFLEVRVGNGGAISLYRSLGFVDVVVRKNYYPDGEDALLMEWNKCIQGENNDR